MMKIYYVTLNDADKTQKISRALLEKKLAACTNWFPISSAYIWEGEMKETSEVVLIIKTKENMRASIEALIAEYIDYTTCIAELDVCSVNKPYLEWLQSI